MPTEQEKERRRRRWPLALALVLGALVLAFVAWDAAASEAISDKLEGYNRLCCVLQDQGRAAAERQVTAMLLLYCALPNSPDPQPLIDTMVEAFAADGVWSAPPAPATANAFGHDEINAALQNYWTANLQTCNGTNVSRLYWDYSQATLTVEASREAQVTETATFTDLYDENFTVTPMATGTVYTQDLEVVARFDCDGRLAYFRIYGDFWQRLSTFTTDYPAVCRHCSRSCHHHGHGGGHHDTSLHHL